MRVFVTGATGFVGSAVVADLLAAGHQVLGLVRSDASAAALAKTGAEPLRGDLENLDSLRQGAATTDGVIHTGFIHDFANMAHSCTVDRIAIETLGEALAGTNKPLIVSSGTALLPAGSVVTENTPQPGLESGLPRVSEQTALATVAQSVRGMAVRLPPTVHGAGDHGFIPILIGIAREKGVSAYVNDGQNHWPAVHRPDAARLYRLAFEHGRAGAIYHAIAEQGVPFKLIAETIGSGLGVPVVSQTQEEAAAHFGWFGHFVGVDNRVSSAKTQAELGWRPTGATLIDDLTSAGYFQK